MTRFEYIVVAIISISMVSGFTITAQSKYEQTRAKLSPTIPAKPVNEASTVSTSSTALEKTTPLTKTAPSPATAKKIPLSKRQFYSNLLPFIEEENLRLANQRQHLIQMQNDYKSANELSAAGRGQLHQLATTYRVLGKITPQTIPAVLAKLLVKVDQIPASLVLAQGANESAWGRSRFAAEGNNYFGVWCFKPGCGIVPSGRPEDAKYEVTKYHSIQDSVNAYFLNINSHPAYKHLRQIRAELRANNAPVTGSALAAGLTSYSSRGDAYIEELRAMIRYNNLEGITTRQL